MIDIDKIFDIEKVSNKGNLKSINITNPILYIFIGEDGNKILKEIYDFNEMKQVNSTGAVDYINISTKLCDFLNNNNLILDGYDNDNFIDRRQQICQEFDKYNDIIKILSHSELKFLERSYSMPVRRRIHFIIESYNEYSCLLTEIIETVKNFFTSRNLVSIIDVFALINDKPDNTDIQKSSTYMIINDLKLIKDSINMIYLLSNINSLRTVSKEEDIYKAIAKTTLIKEFDYSNQPYDFSYNETKLIENTKTVKQDKRGIFYSLGFKIIERPNDILKLVALSILIENNKLLSENEIISLSEAVLKGFVQILNNISKNPLKTQNFMEKDNIMSVMFYKDSAFNDCTTNGQVIDNFFGANLDKYFDYNVDLNLSFDKNLSPSFITQKFENFIADSNVGYFEAVKILKRVAKNLNEIKQNLLSNKEETTVNLKNWKLKKFVYKKRLFENIYNPIFDVAKEYISYLYKLFIPNVALDIFDEFELKLNSLIETADLLNEEIKLSHQKLIDTANLKLADKGNIVKINFIEYYMVQLKKYIGNNYDEYFKNVYSKIFEFRDDINVFYGKCADYINTILAAPEFNLNVYDEISQRLINNGNSEYNEISINNLFNQEITDNKFYYIKLINETNFYSNICVLTDNNSIIKKITNSEVNYIVYSGESKLEILYFIGTFDDKSLTYNNLYYTSYELVKKEMTK